MQYPDGFETDKATLPKFFRWLIKTFFASWILYAIDEAGTYHDLLTFLYPENAPENRRLFLGVLIARCVPLYLIYPINFGLWIYDISPNWLQAQLQKTAHN